MKNLGFFRTGWPYKVLKDPSTSQLRTCPAMNIGEIVRFVTAVSPPGMGEYFVEFAGIDREEYFTIVIESDESHLNWPVYFEEIPYR